MTKFNHPWICSQLGSREHYSIPRVLHNEKALHLFLTDFWSSPNNPLRLLPFNQLKKLNQRSHLELQSANVLHWGVPRILFDLVNRRKHLPEWELIELRNKAYQSNLINQLEKLKGFPETGVFFSYAYTANQMFRFFKDRGWKTVLGQIDPGKAYEDLITTECDKFPEWRGSWKRAPDTYWETWREELNMADAIVVNSEWSADCLRNQGIMDDRLKVIPLAYQVDSAAQVAKSYPKTFNHSRPLKILFLGGVSLRKGVHLICEALKELPPNAAVEIHLVGPCEFEKPPIADDRRIVFHGPVSRKETVEFYKNSDIFILPTPSDGFAITQLEAQSQKMPVVVSKNCGKVVDSGVNGYVLDKLSGIEIAKAISICMENPKILEKWSENSGVDARFSLQAQVGNFQALESYLYN